MKFSINHDSKMEVTDTMSKISISNVSIPVLAGILVEAKEDCIVFTCSNGTETVMSRVVVQNDMVVVEEPGSVVINRETLQAAKAMKGTVTFELKGHEMYLKQDKTELAFLTLPAEEYPNITATNQNRNPLFFTGKEFHAMVLKTSFAATDSTTRPILQGICMKLGAENTIAATDSHRVGQVVYKKENIEDYECVVPASALNNVLKVFDLEKDVIIMPCDNQVAFMNGNTIFYIRLLDGNYPDLSRLIPTKFDSEMTVNRTEMMDALKVLSLATKEKEKRIMLTVGTMFLELSITGEISKGKREIIVDSYNGEEGFKIVMNAKFLIQALSALESEQVTFGFSGNQRPVVINPCGISEFNELQLILPMRVA